VDVDERAPVVAGAEIEIAAPAGAVWQILSAIDRWPSWNPDIREMRLEGPPEPGAEFRWKAGPGTIRSRIESVEAPREIGWTGRTLGMRARHVYRLEQHGERTLVRTRESWSGGLTPLLRGPLRRTMQSALDRGLAHLKAAVEG
jgi:hypothetical protein